MPGNEDDRQVDTQTPAADGEYAQLLDDYSHFAAPAEGEVLRPLDL